MSTSVGAASLLAAPSLYDPAVRLPRRSSSCSFLTQELRGLIDELLSDPAGAGGGTGA